MSTNKFVIVSRWRGIPNPPLVVSEYQQTFDRCMKGWVSLQKKQKKQESKDTQIQNTKNKLQSTYKVRKPLTDVQESEPPRIQKKTTREQGYRNTKYNKRMEKYAKLQQMYKRVSTVTTNIYPRNQPHIDIYIPIEKRYVLFQDISQARCMKRRINVPNLAMDKRTNYFHPR